jgi:hypothetical protein
MRRTLLATLTALLLWIAPAGAQPPPAPTPQANQAKSDETTSAPVMPWAAALVFTLAILVIVCMPSRKA